MLPYVNGNPDGMIMRRHARKMKLPLQVILIVVDLLSTFSLLVISVYTCLVI